MTMSQSSRWQPLSSSPQPTMPLVSFLKASPPLIQLYRFAFFLTVGSKLVVFICCYNCPPQLRSVCNLYVLLTDFNSLYTFVKVGLRFVTMAFSCSFAGVNFVTSFFVDSICSSTNKLKVICASFPFRWNW